MGVYIGTVIGVIKGILGVYIGTVIGVIKGILGVETTSSSNQIIKRC